MNKWLCFSLQIAVIIGTALGIYFFPAEESVDDFARGLLGFIVIYCLEGFKE